MSRFACAVIKSGKRQDRSFKKVPKGKLYDKLRKVSPMEEKYTNIWWTLKKKEHERIVKRKEEEKPEERTNSEFEKTLMNYSSKTGKVVNNLWNTLINCDFQAHKEKKKEKTTWTGHVE